MATTDRLTETEERLHGAIHALEQSLYNSTLWARRPDHETHDDHHAECQECLFFGNPAFHRAMARQQQQALEVLRFVLKT